MSNQIAFSFFNVHRKLFTTDKIIFISYSEQSLSSFISTFFASEQSSIYEFGIPDENSDTIYNIDIYLLSQAPIYEYGEEILEAN